MAFKVFAPGVLTSSDVNTFLMRQAVITCTSSTRPSSPSEGMTIYETDTDAYAKYDGSAWVYQGLYVSYTPTTSGWTAGDATIQTAYARVGDFVHYRGRIIWGSTSSLDGTLGIELSVPLSPSNSPDLRSQFGGLVAIDLSASAQFTGFSWINDTGGATYRLRLSHYYIQGFTARTGIWNTTFAPFTPAASDQFWFDITYEAA